MITGEVIHDIIFMQVVVRKCVMPENKWYNMLFQVRGNYVTCKNLDTGESYIGYTGNTVGLNPYIMVYLNYCEMIVREIKIEHL